VKEFPDFFSAQHGSASIWLKRNLASPSMIDLLADADLLLERSDAVIIKDQRKIKVGRVPLEWDGEKLVVYIKRYNAFSLRHRLQSVFSCSGAQKSLHGAAALSAIGVSTARPIAAIEHRCRGMLVKSFFVSEEILRGKTADAYWREDAIKFEGVAGFRRRRVFLEKLAELFSRLHARDVYHNDLKDANILVGPDGGVAVESFHLLDLEGVQQFAHLSRRRRIKNLVQLNRTLGRYLTQTERWYFLTRYLSLTEIDRPTRKRWAEQVLRMSTRLDRSKDIDHGR
jgi:Lipopolysaccharide kinase (Kdo/WaaP) family